MKLQLDTNTLQHLEPVVHKEGVITIDGFLSPEQCRQFIDLAEQGGFEPATVRMKEGAQMRTDIRNNDRYIFDDFDLAAELWTGVEPFMDAFDLDVQPVALNERFRFYRYDPSQRFKRHRDGIESIRGLTSRVTFMVYLNDDCRGGETTFIEYAYEDGKRVEDAIRIAPKTGTALMFKHRLWHEGTPVQEGRKYVLRTDVLCDPTKETITK